MTDVLGALRMTTQNLPASVERGLALGVDITPVNSDRRRLEVKKHVSDPATVTLGRLCVEAMHDSAVGIDAEMRFHAEAPLGSLLRGRHLLLAPTHLILG